MCVSMQVRINKCCINEKVEEVNGKRLFVVQLTDLLTNPCGIPWGWTADIAETVGGGPADGGTDVGAPALCGASCGVVLWACCNPPE